MAFEDHYELDSASCGGCGDCVDCQDANCEHYGLECEGDCYCKCRDCLSNSDNEIEGS